MTSFTTFTVKIGDRTTRVRVPHDAADDFGIPLSAAEALLSARSRAVQKMYGRRAFWFPDSGLPGYGQVFEPCQTGGSNSVTYRVHCEVTAETPFPVDHAAREQALREYELDSEDGDEGADDGENRPVAN